MYHADVMAKDVARFVLALTDSALEVLLRAVTVHVQVEVLAMAEALSAQFTAKVLYWLEIRVALTDMRSQTA